MSDEGAMRLLAALLEARTGQQLAPNRQWRFEATLKPLMRERRLPTLDALAVQVAGRADPALADRVVEALLNNETSFFRDPVSFQLLNEALIEKLRPHGPKERRLRIWCAGCSTGQEAYALAMIGEELAAALPGSILEITATDVSASAIEVATRGVFTQFEVQRGLPVRHLVRWFEQDGAAWRVGRELRRNVRFVCAGLAAATVPGPFDLILCRNVLLYFASPTRRRMFDVLAGALAADGQLMLGAGETVLGQTDRFIPDQNYRGLYRKAMEAGRRASA